MRDDRIQQAIRLLNGDATHCDELEREQVVAWLEAWRPQIFDLMDYLRSNGWAGGLSLVDAVKAFEHDARETHRAD